MSYQSPNGPRGAAANTAAPVERLEGRLMLAAWMVADVNPTTPDSHPAQFTDVNGRAVFTMRQNGSGPYLLYASDGTATGTQQIGAFTLDPLGLTRATGAAYFLSTGSNGTRQLWRTDGTFGGTVQVSDFPGGSPRNVTAAGPDAFLTTATGNIGEELYVCRATAGGGHRTELVKDINSGSAGSSPARLTWIDGFLYFTADDGLHGRELWRSDGTADGTYMVSDVSPGPAGTSFTELAGAGGRLFFGAGAAAGAAAGTGAELWASDGTAGGTVLVRDIRPGPEASSPASISDVGGVAHFVADDGAHGAEVWRSDGTEAGTWLVRDVRPGPASSGASRLLAHAGRLFFVADDGATGEELWVTNAAGGATLVSDIYPVSNSSAPQQLTGLGASVFFAATDLAGGTELWRSDGTDAGTWRVRDVFPGATGSGPTALAAVGARLFFAAEHEHWGNEPFVSNGTPTGTRAVDDFSASPGYGQPAEPEVAGGSLYFTARPRSDGLEALLRTDGTAAGTHVVRAHVAPFWTTALADDKLVFQNGIQGNLWASDGTSGGTVPISDVNIHWVDSTQPFGAVNLNGALVFNGRLGFGQGWELWRSDGTAAGTSLLKDINPGTGDARPGWMAVAGGAAYFFAFAPGFGYELWRTDGTPDGTRMVHDIRPGPAGSVGTGFEERTETIALGDSVIFVANDGVNGREVWRSDGTAEGTILLTDLSPPGGTVARIGGFARAGARVYFVADDAAGRRNLWRSDGTPGGTVQLFSHPTYRVLQVRPFQGGVAFVTTPGPDATTGFSYGLWFGDGTGVGSTHLKTLTNTTGAHSMTVLAEAAGHLYFTVDDGTHGHEMWSTDGTAGGTRLVRDINPGSAHGGANWPVVFDGRLYFTATSALTGSELWAAAAPDAVAPTVASSTFDVNVAPHELAVHFSEDLPAGLAVNDVTVLNLMTNEPLTAGQVRVRYTPGVHRATLTFPGLPDGLLTDGRWRVTLRAAGLVDGDGNAMAADHVFEFSFLRGDANGDARVNLDDFNILAANFGQAPRTFGQGDFTYDGTVNLLDFNVLASRFGQSLAPAGRPGSALPPGEVDDEVADALSDLLA